MLRSRKQRILVSLGVVLSLAIAAVAVAYFTASGSGTGSATVGSASPWTVSVSAATGGPLYPGSGTETLAYSVANSGSGAQSLSATSASVVSYSGPVTADAGDVTQSGSPVPGCLASWFTATNTPPTPLPQTVAGSGSVSGGSVAVSMEDSGTNQNACQGVDPDIAVSAS